MPKIAIAQIEVYDELDKNVKKILNFIDRAASRSADIVCFPESCLGENILSIKCKEILEIQERCQLKSIYCIFGAHIRKNKKILNSAVLVNRKGNIQYIYNKRNLFPGLDLKKVSPGKTNRVINTDFGKIGIIICWDFAFPEDIRQLSRNGAQIIFCPSYLLTCSKISKNVLRSYPQTRAFENLCYFVSCDAFTDEVLCESSICSPLRTLCKISNQEGLRYAELDLKKVDVLRKRYNCLRPQAS